MREQNSERIFDSAKKGDTAFFMGEVDFKEKRRKVIKVGKVGFVSDETIGIEEAGGCLNVRVHGEYSDSFDALVQMFGLPPITDETELRGIGGRIIALADVHGYDDALQSALFLVGKRLGEE